MENLLKQISNCTECARFLELGPRPVMAAHPESRIMIIGQAPGLAVHKSGVPWDDKSGDNLRGWLGITKQDFYNPAKVGILPMGFCYPGKGSSGDLPPRKECAPLWHDKVWDHVKEVRLTLLIGKYAQDYYLQGRIRSSLTDTVRNYREYLPHYFVLPHPSPRNNIWQAKNPWFREELIPELQGMVREILK